MVVGSRTLGSADPNTFSRELGLRVFNRVLSGITRQTITDCSSGYRAVRADALGDLVLRQEQFHASEFLIESVKRGLRLVEVPVTIAARTHGQTKKGTSLRYGARLRQRHPAHLAALAAEALAGPDRCDVPVDVAAAGLRRAGSSRPCRRAGTPRARRAVCAVGEISARVLPLAPSRRADQRAAAGVVAVTVTGAPPLLRTVPTRK